MLPALLADVNVAVEVVAFLRASDVDVVSVVESGWTTWTDDEILAESVRTRRFVLTHDADFGRLAFAEGRPFHGILRLRPGDDPPAVVISGLRSLVAAQTDWTPPMIARVPSGQAARAETAAVGQDDVTEGPESSPVTDRGNGGSVPGSRSSIRLTRRLAHLVGWIPSWQPPLPLSPRSDGG